MQLILEPGFSTAENLTQAAGRGVGMDVVATEVKKLGGALHMETTPGQGSRFIIRLPFTLAVSHALIVRIGDEFYALPLPTVEGVVRVPRDEVQQHLASDTPFVRLWRSQVPLPAPGEFRRHGGRPAARPGADAAGGAGARRRAFHRPGGRGADRQPRNRREAGGSADRRRSAACPAPPSWATAASSSSSTSARWCAPAGAARRGRDRAAREARSAHRRAGGGRFHHRASRDAAPAGAQRHARADRARWRGCAWR